MKQSVRGNEKIISILKSLLVAYIATGALLLFLALLLYKFCLSEKIISIGIIVIYIGASFLGGLLMGKQVGNKRFLWGLIIGSLYFLILVIISLIAGGGFGVISGTFFWTLLLCCTGGMLGGMLS